MGEIPVDGVISESILQESEGFLPYLVPTGSNPLLAGFSELCGNYSEIVIELE